MEINIPLPDGSIVPLEGPEAEQIVAAFDAAEETITLTLSEWNNIVALIALMTEAPILTDEGAAYYGEIAKKIKATIDPKADAIMAPTIARLVAEKGA